MAFWNRKKVEKKAPQYGSVNIMNWGEAPDRANTASYLGAYKEIYSLFGIAHRISTAVSEAKWRLYKGTDRSERSQVASHPIITLLDYANEFQTGQEIVELTQLHLDLTGRSYWYLSYNKLGVPSEIWVLPPDRVKIIPSRDKFIAGYMYKAGNEDIKLTKKEIIRFTMPDPSNPYGATGFVQPASVILDSEIYAGKWDRNFFYNSARPDGVIEAEDELSEEQRKSLEKSWAAGHQGLSRAHKLGVLERGLKYKTIGTTQKDMDFVQMRKFTREGLLFAFGMPQSTMGVSENVNRANAEAGDYIFARWLVKPRLVRIRNKLNEQLVPLFPLAKNVEIDFDEVVPETLEQKQALAESGVKAGWMTVNEARQLNDFDPLPSGDVFLIPLNLIPSDISKPLVAPPEAPPSEAPKSKGWATEEKKELLWRAYVTKAENFERLFIPALKTLWAEQEKEVLANINKDNLFDKKKNNDKFLKKLKPLVVEVFTESFEDAENLINPEPEHRSKQLNEESMNWIDEHSAEAVTGINEVTRTKLQTAIAEGVAQGEDIPTISRRIRAIYEGFDINRSKLIARTEVITASNEGAIRGYKEAGVEESEFYAALDERTCEECMAFHGRIYKTKEARGIIPVHPMCRCCWLPVI